MEIVVSGAEERALWDAYVRGSCKATMCHQFLWQPIIEQTYGHKPLYLMARSDGVVRGILPLFVVKSRLFGKTLASMPFLDYGGVCADDEGVAQSLLGHARHSMREHGVDYIELRQCEPLPSAGALRLDKVSMIVDLTPGGEAVWQLLPAKVRNQVRKAEKSGLTADIGGPELLGEFYSVFAVNMRDLASPVHHRDFFANIFNEFGEQARLIVVRDGQRAVGGLVCLFFKDTILVPWASSLREYFQKCPNNLLYWEAIQHGCARGCKRFDFGRSTVNSGPYNFKRQWGAVPMQLYWHVLSQNGDCGMAPSTGDAGYRVMLETWKRLPVSFTKVIGPRIRKYLTN